MLRTKIFFIAFFCAGIISATAQERLEAFQMNERLGRGINMGNLFEAPSETAWGDPWDPEYFKIMSDLGFSHVRLPVRWEPADRSMASSPYTINPDFLDRIQEVVDTALSNGLHIIVNMHHHEALYDDPAGQKDRFLSQWDQIANHFQDYPDSVLFEVMNEPHGNLTPELWNEYFADALTMIRNTNPTRMVLMGTAEYGGLGGVVHLQIPDDEYLILTVHYYNPFNFTHQGADWVGPQSEEWLGTEWHDTEADRESITSDFAYAVQYSETNHIPLHVGEFGAYEEADLDSRTRWTNFLARWFEEQDLSWAYWEFRAGFGIYNPDTKQYLTPLVDALLHDEMSEPTPVQVIPLYNSDFTGGTDGWILQDGGGASSSLSASGGKLNISIDNAGSESWHVQLIKRNIPLEKDRTYRISFKAIASESRSASFYAGKDSDPWNAYSGYNGISIPTNETAYSFTFTMANPTDMNARLVFDFGKDTTGVSVTEIKVDELILMTTSLDDVEVESQVNIYPNPFETLLYCEDLDKFDYMEVYDLQGRLWRRSFIETHDRVINLDNIPKGMYLLRLEGKGKQASIKIVKK
jgi:aryl-phospho-beta-D-glucosidase BglC (GH1 family)